jgi:hypothetical protein
MFPTSRREPRRASKSLRTEDLRQPRGRTGQVRAWGDANPVLKILRHRSELSCNCYAPCARLGTEKRFCVLVR